MQFDEDNLQFCKADDKVDNLLIDWSIAKLQKCINTIQCSF